MPEILILNDANLDEQLPVCDVPVVVDQWASWRGPFRLLGPVIEQITPERSETIKVGNVNVDEQPALDDRAGSAASRTSFSTATGQATLRRLVGQECAAAGARARCSRQPPWTATDVSPLAPRASGTRSPSIFESLKTSTFPARPTP